MFTQGAGSPLLPPPHPKLLVHVPTPERLPVSSPPFSSQNSPCASCHPLAHISLALSQSQTCPREGHFLPP